MCKQCKETKKPRAARAARKAVTTLVTDLAIRRGETGLTVYNHERRFVKAAAQAVGRFLAKIGAWLAKSTALKRLEALKSRGGMKIAEKGKGAKYADQKDAGKKISKDKNWENCLNGKSFAKGK